MICDGWWSEARALPSPNFNARPGVPIDMLVVHSISLPPACFGTGNVQQFFQNQLDCSAHPYFDEIRDMRVSAHVFIDRDGCPYQFVSFEDRAWHAGASEFDGRSNCNDFAIGVELEGCDDVAYTEPQYDCLVALTHTLMQTYPALSMNRVVGHSDIAPGRKTDPGPAFDWARYKTQLNQLIEGAR